MKSKRTILLAAGLLMISVLRAPGYFRRSPESSAHFNYLMALQKLRRGDTENALAYLEKAAGLDEESAAIRWDLFEIYYMSGDYSQARQVGEELLALEPGNIELMETMAEFYSYLGEQEKALEMYEEILEEDPGHLKVRQNFALYLLEEGRYKEAMRNFQKILKKDPSNVNTVIGVADLYMKKGRYRASVRVYRQAAEYGADRRDINLHIARLYSYTGPKFRAVKYLRENIEENPGDIQSIYLLADIYREENKISEAEEMYTRLLDITGEDYTININRGTMYLAAGKEERGEEIFEELTRSHPREFYSWYLLGLSRVFRGDYREAVNPLERALEIREDVDVYFNLGVAAHKRGEEETAYEMFKRCIEMDPDHDLALNYLGYLWADRGINLDLAQEYIARALEIEPGKAAYIDSMGWVYYRRGKYEKAFEKIKTAAELERNAEIFEHLGDVYIKLGKPSAALKVYTEALEMDPGNETLIEKIEKLRK